METITINPISSQRYLDEDIVNSKKIQIAGLTEIELPVVEVTVGGEIYHILIDGHHRFEAAKNLNITVLYNVIDIISEEKSEDYLVEKHYGDDYYYINSNQLVW